jgi:hypothetical protein
MRFTGLMHVQATAEGTSGLGLVGFCFLKNVRIPLNVP